MVFSPLFFSEDASSNVYWQDSIKVERGRPFFKKYISVIKQLSRAGWQPVTYATAGLNSIRIERFGDQQKLFFTIRNNGSSDTDCIVSLNLEALHLKRYTTFEMIDQTSLNSKDNHVYIKVPAGRTKVIQIITAPK